MPLCYNAHKGSDIMFSPDKIKGVDICSIMKFTDSVYKLKFSQNGKLQTNEFIYRISGDNITTFNGKKIFNTRKSLEFLPKGRDEAKYHVDIHNVGDSIVIYFDTDYTISDMPFVINTSNTEIGNFVIQMEKLWSKKEFGYYQRCMSLFYQILYEIKTLEDSNSVHKYRDKIKPAIDYIHTNYCSPDFSIKALPEMCNMSYSYFKKLFMLEFKMTASKYVTKLRMNRAAELMFLQDRNITEMSQILGYENVYYFSKVFKDYFGMSPTAYKNQISR